MWSILVLIALVASFFATMPARPALASTCTMRPEPDPQKRLESRLDDATLVVIGRVRTETPSDATIDAYSSSIDVEVLLKGELPDDPLTLDYLSEEWNCGGGPRLREGTLVMLLLNKASIGSTADGEPVLIWETGPTGGNVLFGINGAILDDYRRDRGESYLGKNEDVARYVASAVGASEEDTERAVVVASSTTRSGSGTSELEWLLVAGGMAGLIALITVAASWMRMRKATDG